MNPPDSNQAKAQLTKLVFLYAEATDEQRVSRLDDFESYVAELGGNGYDRGDLYNLIFRIHRENEGKLPEVVLDWVSDYLLAMAGHCAPSCAVRLPGDPEDPSAFINYIRSLKWMK